MPRARRSVLIAIWCVAIVVAGWADGPAARWARATGVAHAVAASRWATVAKLPGAFPFTAAVIVGLLAARRIDRRAAAYVLAVAAVGGLNFAVKWAVGRRRPFKLPPDLTVARPFALHPFPGGIVGLFVQPRDLSFPSGHACTAAALAAGVWVVDRPVGRVLAGLAVVVGVERVAEDAHYVSDVVAAYGFAVAGAVVVWRVIGGWVRPPPRFDLPGRRP